MLYLIQLLVVLAFISILFTLAKKWPLEIPVLILTIIELLRVFLGGK